MFDESRFPRHPRVTLAQCHCVARRMEAARPPLQRLPTDTAGTKPGRPREEYGCSLTILCPDVEDGGGILDELSPTDTLATIRGKILEEFDASRTAASNFSSRSASTAAPHLRSQKNGFWTSRRR